MSKISVNSFEAGMNFDSSRVVQKKNTAHTITNFRPWTDEDGKAVGGLLNIKGNELSFQIPDTSPVYQFVTSYDPAYPATDTIQIVLAAATFNINFNFTADGVATTNAAYTQYIVDTINTDATAIANNIRAFLLDTDTILVAHLGPQEAGFQANDGSIYLAKTTYLASQANVQIIGWTTIRDNYYLFTTNDTTTTGGPGQIWKLAVSEVDKSTTLSIVYNGQLNFSTKYPIEAIGRYENECTKRVYWTDNFNQVRTLNTEATDVFFTDPDNINLIPSLFHSIPILQSIQGGGALESGMWQFAYRLRTSTGGETSFSPISRMIPIVEADENGTNYWEYLGGASGVNTGKSITIRIDNLDEDYTWIELVSLYRSTKQSTPVVTSVTTQAIDVEGEFEYTITGNELNSYELSLEEFLLASRAFTHAKTITSKDNRLFAANTKYEGLDLDYDARAYAHALSSTTFNIDGSPETVFANIADDANCINDDYSVNKFAQSSTDYGGTGTNISYLIKTRQILADDKKLDPTLPGGNYDSLPIRTATGNYSTFDLGEGVTYPQPNLWKSLKNPYVFDLFKGYQRDEIYRFAIVFYDKQGNPGYAKWIADIKIPEAFDSGRSVYSGGDDYTNGSFRGRLVEKVGGDTYYNIPYIEFTVDTSSIQEDITGYSIVRVERRKEDRTVVGQGLAFRTGPLIEVKAGATKDLSTPMGDCAEEQQYLFTSKPGITIEDYGDDANDYDPSTEGFTATTTYSLFDYASEYMTVQFPEHLYTNEISFSTGDTIKTVDTFSSYNTDDYDWNYKYTPATDYQSIVMRKQYDDPDAVTFPSVYAYGTDSAGSAINNLEVDIEDLWKIPQGTPGGEVLIDNSIIFRNEIYAPYDPNSGPDPTSAYHGWGQKTLLIKLDTTDPGYPLYSNSETLATAGTHPNIFAALGPELTTSTATNDGGTNGASDGHNHYIVNYKRALANQYGGNTYIDKTQNIYISTGNFIAVNPDSATSVTSDVYGGDTFMTVMDVQKFAKSWDFNSDFATPRRSMTFLFPVESPIHTEYRHGIHVQSHGYVDSGVGSDTERNNDDLTGNTDISETYTYNTVFSADNNIIKFYSKPFDFQASDCTDLYDTRIYASEPKINGEVKDSWRIVGTNEFIDLESLYGPVNKIITHNDTFFTFQDRAVSTVAINPRVQTTTSDGNSLELGTGAVLHDYTYLSNSIGCKHQWGVIPGKGYVYWIDINNNKLYRVSTQGLEPLSDMKGLFSYLDKNLVNNIRLNELNGGDNPIEDKGINGYYDYENNEVVFTAVGNGVTFDTLGPGTDGNTYVFGDVVYISTTPYKVVEGFTYDDALGTGAYSANLQAIHSAPKGFTICFNEFIHAFSSFYTFESPVYLYDPSTLFSVDSQTRQDIYLHNEGARGDFYGFVNDSDIKFYLNEMPVYTKVFDNLLWHTESIDTTGSVVNDDTFYLLKCFTTYQETNYTNLVYNNNLKRKERTWQTYIPRSTTNQERMRDKHMEIELYYDNTDNNRFLVHLIGNVYRPSIR